MKTLASSAFCIGAAAIFAGCAPSAMPQSQPSAIAAHGESWTPPEAKGKTLLYVATGRKVSVLSYPDGRSVGGFSIRNDVYGLCSDPSGDVFVTTVGTILEYAYGGDQPIKEIEAKFGVPLQCAFDPSTGNLAVVSAWPTGPDDIVIYEKLTEKTRYYYDSDFYNFFGIVYDGSGNLFVDGAYSAAGTLAELPKGGDAFTNYDVALKTSDSQLGWLQWDGQYLTAQETPPDKRRALLDRLTIADSHASVVSRTQLDGDDIRFRLLSADVALGFEDHYDRSIGLWHYPTGRAAFKVFTGVANKSSLMALSASP